jgi:hypothetical protein
MYIEKLLKKYDLDPEIFNPMKRNYILNKTTPNNTLNNVCLSDPPPPTPTRTHLLNLIQSRSPMDVCLLDSSTIHPRSNEGDEELGSELNTDDETNSEDTDIIEDVTKLLTPYLCRKDCIHYDPVKPSETNGNKELKEFCKLSDRPTSPGNVCSNYKNKNEKDALELEGCLSFN